MKSCLEIFFVAPESHDSIQYFKVHIDITDDMSNPDEIIIGLAGISLDTVPSVTAGRIISHSTSWRYEYHGTIYLTYLIYSENMHFGQCKPQIISVRDMELSRSSSAGKPRPETVQEKHIISHGMRHLSYLVENTRDGMFNCIISGKSQLLFSQILPALAMKFG